MSAARWKRLEHGGWLVKVLTLVKHGGEAGAEERWRDYLAALTVGAGKLGGLVRVVQNDVIPGEVRVMPGNRLVGWEAVTEFWFDDAAAAREAVARLRADTAQGRPAGAPAVVTHLIVDERLLHESGIRPLPVKMMVLFRCRPDLTRAASQAYWQGPHARLGMERFDATKFLKRYFQNHPLLDDANPDAAYDYDGVPEYWLEDAEKMANVAADSEVMVAIAEDEKNFADTSSIETLRVRETQVFARDPAAPLWVAG